MPASRDFGGDDRPLTATRPGPVLVVENDAAVGELVRWVLADEGYAAAVLASARPGAVRAAVDSLEPACVLLDGGGALGYGTSWGVAAWPRGRGRPVPVVMFTAHAGAAAEARAGASARSRDFAAVLPKPFGLEELVAAVVRAAGSAPGAGCPA